MFQTLTLVGNLGSDPEMRLTASGTSVASFTLAVNKTWVTQDGEKKEKTTWFRITAWRKLAETAAQHLAKGRQILQRIISSPSYRNVLQDALITQRGGRFVVHGCLICMGRHDFKINAQASQQFAAI